MKRFLTLVLVFVSLFAVVSCGGKKKVEPNEGNKPLPEEEVTKEVSAEEGGTVTNEDESVSIDIPAGALENDTTITIKVYDAKGYPGTEDKTVISKIVEFEPSGTIFKKTGYNFYDQHRNRGTHQSNSEKSSYRSGLQGNKRRLELQPDRRCRKNQQRGRRRSDYDNSGRRSDHAECSGRSDHEE